MASIVVNCEKCGAEYRTNDPENDTICRKCQLITPRAPTTTLLREEMQDHFWCDDAVYLAGQGYGQAIAHIYPNQKPPMRSLCGRTEQPKFSKLRDYIPGFPTCEECLIEFRNQISDE